MPASAMRRPRRSTRFRPFGLVHTALLSLAMILAGCQSDNGGGVNRPPETPTISAPAAGETFAPGEAIQFQGSATDPEDGPLTGVRLVWTSNRDGQIGTGASFSRSNLSTGAHTITLRAIDSDGASSSTTVSITIESLPPGTPTITSPTDGAAFSTGQAITFQGSADDPEDGALTGASLVWTSDRDGQIGTGETFSRSNLSQGDHTITLTATDSDDLSSSASVDITIENQPPATPTITAPDDGGSAVEGTPVTFTGSATDVEDGGLTGAALVWTSDLDGEIGTGTTFNRDDLSPGTHTITLTATDSGGLTSSTSIEFSVLGRPVVTLTEPTAGAVFESGTSIQFTGSAEDFEDGLLPGASLVWTSSIDGQIGVGTSFSTPTLSIGAHVITLTATDSDGEIGTASVSISVQPAGAPTATITAPTDNATFAPGAVITFQGSATDPQDGAITGSGLSWSSSIDGPIGNGTTFSTATLSAGTHVITLTATDSGGLTGQATVTITISAPPVATITDPADGANVAAGASVAFEGTGTDPEDGALTGGSLVWTSTLDGQIGTGESFSTTTLSSGTHQITLTVTDSDGVTGTDQISLTVTPPGSPPTATITGPADGHTVNVGTNIDFTGTGSDPEDGTLAGGSLVWTSNLAGQFGTGTAVSTAALSAGVHTITLTATDSHGWTDTDQITVTVQGPPTATITAPADGATVIVGASTQFTGTGTDPEDGTLTGASLVWTSNVDGQIGTGTSFTTAALTAGAHTITLTVTDSDAMTDDDSIDITVTNAPTATITGPADGGNADQGVSVDFTGTGNDTEDGPLTGASLVWTSSIDGQFGTGTSVSTSTLSAGTHTITLTATDSHGATGTDQITFTVNSTTTPIEVQVGATASSAITTGAQTALPIIVDMTNAAGRNVASIQVRVTWSTGVATHVSSTTTIGATINTNNAATGEVIANWFTGGAGNTSTFTLFTLTLQGAAAGATTVTVEVQTIADELATDLSGDTSARNHTLTVN